MLRQGALWIRREWFWSASRSPKRAAEKRSLQYEYGYILILKELRRAGNGVARALPPRPSTGKGRTRNEIGKRRKRAQAHTRRGHQFSCDRIGAGCRRQPGAAKMFAAVPSSLASPSTRCVLCDEGSAADCAEHAPASLPCEDGGERRQLLSFSDCRWPVLRRTPTCRCALHINRRYVAARQFQRCLAFGPKASPPSDPFAKCGTSTKFATRTQQLPSSPRLTQSRPHHPLSSRRTPGARPAAAGSQRHPRRPSRSLQPPRRAFRPTKSRVRSSRRVRAIGALFHLLDSSGVDLHLRGVALGLSR